MNLPWKRVLLPLAASLALVSSASAQDWAITSHGGSKSASANLSVGSHGLKVGFGWDRNRGRSQAPSGYYKTVRERVWVPGRVVQEWVPDRYGWVYDPCGRKRWAVVQHGYYRQVQTPGCYEWQNRRIWVSYRTHGYRDHRSGHRQDVGRSRGRSITRGH